MGTGYRQTFITIQETMIIQPASENMASNGTDRDDGVATAPQ